MLIRAFSEEQTLAGEHKKVLPDHELTYVSCTHIQPSFQCAWCHICSLLYAKRGPESKVKDTELLWYHCYSAQSEYFNHCASRECLDKVNTPIDTEVATGTTIGLLWRPYNRRARSTSTVTAATGKQTSRATRGAGVGSIETTLICNLTNLQQLLLTHTGSGVTWLQGREGVEILNISVEGGTSQSVSLQVTPVQPIERKETTTTHWFNHTQLRLKIKSMCSAGETDSGSDKQARFSVPRWSLIMWPPGLAT